MSRGELGSTQTNLRGPRREPPRVEPSLPYTRHCVTYRVLTRSERREVERERESSQCVISLLESLFCRCVSLREKCTGRVFLVF